MDILQQFEGTVNGTLEPFGRTIINGYIQSLHSFRLFLYYLIQKYILFKDFDFFARTQTDTLCNHIENYISQQGCTLTYLNLKIQTWFPYNIQIYLNGREYLSSSPHIAIIWGAFSYAWIFYTLLL